MKRLLILCILACFIATAQAQTTKPITIGVTEEITSAILGEKRSINIYLPEDYNAKDTTRYQVIYLLDGGLDEDFIHIAGLVQFSTFPWVNMIPKSIVVGIANTDRKRDMGFPTTVKSEKEKFPTTGGSAKFISFIEKELQPYIRSHYPVNNSSVVIGQSFAGLLATEILMKKPTMFTSYIIVSPSLWWDNGSLIQASLAPLQSLTTPVNVYLACGKEGLAPTEQPHVMELEVNVLADRINALKSKQVSLYFDYMPAENHATALHPAVQNAFRYMQTHGH